MVVVSYSSVAYHGLLKQGTIYSGGDQLQFSGLPWFIKTRDIFTVVVVSYSSVAYHGLLKQGTYLQWW